ncbi:MAG: cation transporter [Bacteroidetes bacterium]|nr:cation transporter [Bacteroidota bacterium]
MAQIKFKEKAGYGFGDMASSMFWKIFGMYSLFFYTDVFGISAAAAGTMFLVARLWDSFFDIGVGIMADRTKTRWGKYRPYLLWFAIPFSVMGVITFFVPDFGQTGKLIYAYITYSLMMIVYSLINVPYASLLGVMSPDPKMRSPVGWTLGVLVIGVICSVLFFLCFSFTRERVEAVSKEENENISVKQDLQHLLHNSPWWILVGTGLAALLFNAVRDGVAIYYFRDYVGSNYTAPLFGWDIATIYFLVGQAANIVGVVLAPSVSARFGKRNTYMLAMVIAAVLSIVFFFIPNNVTLILILQVLISVCAGYVLPLLWSMFSDIVDYQEYKTNRRASGLIFSSSSMSQKLGWALGAALGGWILAIFKYNPDIVTQLPQTILGERLMLSVFPAICALLAAVGMLLYPLTEDKVKQIAEELNKRRENAK